MKDWGLVEWFKALVLIPVITAFVLTPVVVVMQLLRIPYLVAYHVLGVYGANDAAWKLRVWFNRFQQRVGLND